MLIQGWSIPGLVSDDIASGCALGNFIIGEGGTGTQELKEADIRSLAGNSMRCASIGAFILLAFSASNLMPEHYEINID